MDPSSKLGQFIQSLDHFAMQNADTLQETKVQELANEILQAIGERSQKSELISQIHTFGQVSVIDKKIQHLLPLLMPDQKSELQNFQNSFLYCEVKLSDAIVRIEQKWLRKYCGAYLEQVELGDFDKFEISRCSEVNFNRLLDWMKNPIEVGFVTKDNWEQWYALGQYLLIEPFIIAILQKISPSLKIDLNQEAGIAQFERFAELAKWHKVPQLRQQLGFIVHEWFKANPNLEIQNKSSLLFIYFLYQKILDFFSKNLSDYLMNVSIQIRIKKVLACLGKQQGTEILSEVINQIGRKKSFDEIFDLQCVIIRLLARFDFERSLEICSQAKLKVHDVFSNNFEKIIKAEIFAHLIYAKSLLNVDKKKANEILEKTIELISQQNFNPAIHLNVAKIQARIDKEAVIKRVLLFVEHYIEVVDNVTFNEKCHYLLIAAKILIPLDKEVGKDVLMKMVDLCNQQNNTLYHLRIFRLLSSIDRDSAMQVMTQFLEKANSLTSLWEKVTDLIYACELIVPIDLEWAKKIFHQAPIYNTNIKGLNSIIANIYAHIDIEGAIQFAEEGTIFRLIEVVKVLMPKDKKRALKLLEEVRQLEQNEIPNLTMCDIWIEIGNLLTSINRNDALEAFKKALYYEELEKSRNTIHFFNILRGITSLDKELGMKVLHAFFDDVNSLDSCEWKANNFLEIGTFINTLI